MKSILFLLIKISAFFSLFILLFFSSSAMEAVKEGIFLFSDYVLPALLPFIILSNIWIAFYIPESFQNLVQKLFPHHTFLFTTLPYLFLGLCCGLPIGAIYIRDARKKEYLTKKNADRMLPLCSMVSPMFLVTYVRDFFELTGIQWYLFLVSLYLPSVIWYIIISFSNPIKLTPQFSFHINRQSVKCSEILKNSAITLLYIGLYICLFSLLITFSSELLNQLSWNYLLTGQLELTIGLYNIVNSSANSFATIIKAAGTISFGGLCAAAQIYSVICDTDLSITQYLVRKVVLALCTIGILFILNQIFSQSLPCFL